ncbi:MAG: aspartate--ammonia ligase [Faecousia sp.]
MKKCYIPEGYSNPLSVYETQCAIEYIKHNFQKNLCRALDLMRVSAPLFVEEASGLNDNLNGYERPVSFDVPDVGEEAQVVHSLAKWKRYALARYGFRPGKGLVTDMNAIRRDEIVDNLHSVYVDQWDWEKVLTAETRNVATLKDTVQRIVNAIYVTGETLKIEFPQIKTRIPREVIYVTTQEVEDMFPDLQTAQERETAFHRLHKDKAVFLMQIGGKLRSGKPHDGRAPDYDDWALNGDILFWNDVLDRSYEVSSMGIRVSPESLDRQLTEAGCDDRRELPFHKALLNGELPLTIGGGIGQSRLCMLLLGCAHIGEVQSSIWDQETVKTCADAGVMLL